MTSSQTVEKMKALTIFADFSPTELDALAKGGEFKEFARGETLVAENTEGTDVFVIFSGRIDICLTIPGGTREVLATLEKGQLFGELTLLGRMRRSASVVAKEDVQVFRWTREKMFEIFDVNSRIGYSMMTQIARMLADRLYSTNMILRTAIARTQ